MIDVGSVVNGKYRLVRLVGDGGMGSVYEALHTGLGTRVAIKVLHPDLARRTGLVERFLQEARVSAQIRSPYVVQVTDVDRTADGHAYIVMELLEGEPLSAVLDRQHRLPVPTACEYTLQILQALEAAHALGVIHRDLKPENVFVTFAAGRPILKLIDFGIAKTKRTDPQAKNLTVAGVVMGTAEYMAPEQARSADKVDARADIYAVGVMLYEMIAGSRPVRGDDARVIALKVERGEVIPLVQAAPDVPRELAGLVHRAMAGRPELRFETATEMRLALERVGGAKRGTAAMPVAHGPAPELASATGPTGTLKNVSAKEVFQAAGLARPVTAAAQTPIGTEPSDEAVHTERAPPLATALAQPLPHAMVMTPPAQYAEPRRRRGGGTVIAIVALSLLLGAGVVAILVATGTLSLSNDIATSPPPTTAPEAAATTVPGTPNPPDTTSAVPTLSPTKPGPPVPGPPGPGPGPRPRPADDGGPSPSPFVFPSNIPIPSVFPLPSGFPTAFPSIFPPWPAPPPPAPHASGTPI
jgi:serine/threonine protein kinase